MDQYQLSFIIALLGITVFPGTKLASFFAITASVISCQVYPSEYAYRDDSVTRAESASANCRRYPEIPGLQGGTRSMDYIHCDGTQLKLADTKLGPQQFSSSSHYQWSAGNAEQLLFIFPTRVSLTTITLHYYNDSVRGLPRLRIYAVPDVFHAWDATTINYPRVDIASVPPDGEPAGRRSVSIDFNFNTKKVLMYKYSSSMFAVSEVEFFTCISTTTATPNETMLSVSSLIIYTTATSTSDRATKTIANNTSTKPDTSQATTVKLSQKKDPPSTNLTAAGIVGALLLVAITSLITILSLILWHHKRRARKSEIDPTSGSMREDASYSTLKRGTRQQIQPQDSNSTDQIHLSPSTGQTELISKTESETAEDINISTLNVYSSVDTENFQIISNSEESKVEDATYAVVDKKKKKTSKEVSNDNGNKMEKIEEEVKVQEQPSLEEMYAVVHKKPKKSKEQGETPPPIPASTVESLYTAVQKTPQ